MTKNFANALRAAIALLAAVGAADTTLVLGIPGAPVLAISSNSSDNPWLAANPAICFMGVSAPTGGVSLVQDLDEAQVVLDSAEGGFAIERAKPDYYLSDEIVPPENVDWAATYAAFQTLPEDERAEFIFDDTSFRLFAVHGGTVSFDWILSDGTTRPMTYRVSPACSGRPRRIYWTDYPYNGPAIDLSGKFVKFFGPDELVKPAYGVYTNEVAGLSQVLTNRVVSGLYYDTASHMLYAYGKIQGQVVMAYYDTGLYKRLLHVQTVEVRPPSVNRLTGSIGHALQPDGRGYGTAGLRARPTYVSPPDNRGDYYYQHQGQHSYSPKHGEVYPLRPTVEDPWNMEVYWMETDEMLVDWPFELDQYACDWPKDATVFVRGDVGGDGGRPVYVPSDYTAELMKFQEPEGHARAVATDGTFTTTGEGWSLLKLTADDNVWFAPIRSVLRSNPAFFTLAPQDIRVGRELVLRGGTVAGLAPGFAPICNPDSPGFIYEAASDPVWNPNLYKAAQPDNADSAAATNMMSSATSGDGADTNEYASVIYAVRPGTVEVWWNTTVEQEDMPKSLEIPTLPQVYSARWPKSGEAPQIILASQLGSASESVFSHNIALKLSTSNSVASLPSRKYFDANDGGTVMFWVKPGEYVPSGLSRSVVGFGFGAPQEDLTVALVDVYRRNGTTYLAFERYEDARHVDYEDSVRLSGNAEWLHVAVCLSTTGSVVFVDGQSVYSGDGSTAGILSGACSGTIGERAPYLARVNATVGEILFWNRVLSPEEIETERFKVHTGRENHLTGCFSFLEGTDLNVTGTDRRSFTDKVLGTICTATQCLADENGPPALDSGDIDADGDTTPRIYAQNDPDKTGYNPNEEHALVMPGSGGHVAWALRTDLNTADSSAAGVLVEYVRGGRKAMQWFDVAVTNSVYPELAAYCIAGKAFPGPHPIDMLDDPWCTEDSWDEPVATAPAFRDRKNQLWARAAGTATMRMYYRMQDGFAFPSLPVSQWPAIGTAVPWLSLLGGDPTSPTALDAQPAAWTWRVRWPDAVPEMPIGSTLTVAASGLPEVWNAGSVGVVWPATDAERDATAVLFDPTVAQAVGFSKSTFPTVSAAVTALGIKQGAGGNATLRKGRWTFDGLPPSLSKRFYLDTTADVGSCLKLEGEREDNPAGVSLLHVNVLNAEERATLSTLLDNVANSTGRTAWKAAIEQLATAPVLPSPHTAVSDTEDRIAYAPRDHYALFSMGATNYVTLIQNDSTNELMSVAEGDPISMQILKVVPEYYVGRVVTREDPLNLLSQQLSVIYAEAFAGKPGEYEFEWRKCRPHADGSVPTDFDGEYTQKFEPTEGLTRFVIGGQGDTLANMVNTYYAVRYRAATADSPAYAAMGDAWSAWSDPPALAEGWVQRVLNNVTPFAQRMRDLVENPAETSVSMLRQAGGPFEGDVALSQDNLAEVGLIQLYETLLDKAESMSLQLGIDDPDANKQLQLAVSRLADLYNLLGDEAYDDAMNPTIGIGANFNNTQMTGFEMDYGALSSALFAFDNQVPTLLDEELALLRGRSGENAPALTLSPYYNRLVWNFTRGITAGEVAYAVNYDISGSNTGLIDYQQAAEMYPQGHGDAYGHYLSALSGYYRLLRNPKFTWGDPAMGEMVVADAVLNVDYYDEAKFAKAAYDVAKVASAVVDRTARKAYRDNGGVSSAGYLDEEADRAFGYGEWASRGGFGALANWAVGNALLAPAPDPGLYWRYRFDGNALIYLAREADAARTPLSTDGTWTAEFQVFPGDPSVAAGDSAELFMVVGDGGAFSLGLEEDNELHFKSLAVEHIPVTNTVCHYSYTNITAEADFWFGFRGMLDGKSYTTVSFTNENCVLECAFERLLGSTSRVPTSLPPDYDLAAQLAALSTGGVPAPPEWSGWVCSEPVDEETGLYDPYVYTEETDSLTVGDLVENDSVVGTLPAGENTLVALRCDGGALSVTFFNHAGAVTMKRTGLGMSFSIEPDIVVIGDRFIGEISEVRLWNGVARTDAQLVAKREYVSPLADDLTLYLRAISDSDAATEIADTKTSEIWTVADGEWIEAASSGVGISFEDEGLNRIDRSTVPELASLAGIIPDIQKKVDRMDAGLTPIGLADGAIPFDLTPISAGDGGKTHYEQIRERAGIALVNARRSLDKAQEYGSRLRLLREAETGWENSTAEMELETKNRLIEYFGYPYSGDIGPSGTYPQGYDGPDIYNYTWMEPELYGLTDVKDTVAVTRETKSKPKLLNVFVPILATSESEGAGSTLTFEKSLTGIILKPASVTGKRRAQGKIQDAMADFLIAYARVNSKIETYKNKLEDYEGAVTSADYVSSIVTYAKMGFAIGGTVVEYVGAAAKLALKESINALEFVKDEDEDLATQVLGQTPAIVGAGMTVNTDPRSIVAAGFGNANLAWSTAIKGSIATAKSALDKLETAKTWKDIAKATVYALGDVAQERIATYTNLRNMWYELRSATSDLTEAYRELQTAQAAVETVIAEAERVIDERTLARKQAAGVLTKARYNEMFFRLARNNALSRYESQFDLAQKYAYLAAQAYDYETGLLSSDRTSGDAFLARIVGARTLGEFDAGGEPIVASDAAKGDGGLAAILAEMDGNWLVLKPRLGINNPQPYATWFSLRHDLFRIHAGAKGDKSWKTELRKYKVDDLNAVSEFRRYCQPLAGSSAEKEPGLVIPFSSIIAAGVNFFGNELAGGDASLDPTWFATHVSSAGVHFEGYDPVGLSRTPTAYLVPVGEDRIRAVGDPETVLSWKVVDQTIPAPYAIGSTQLDDPDWTPLYDGATGGNDLGARIRKHPSFRAYYADVGQAPSDASLDCTRLVGRSAWNTRWLLIIPASSLSGDRDSALSAFIEGIDSNRDGTPDSTGVSDILVGLKTYSTSGN